MKVNPAIYHRITWEVAFHHRHDLIDLLHDIPLLP